RLQANQTHPHGLSFNHGIRLVATPRHHWRRPRMSALDWAFTAAFAVIYVFLLFTVCLMTFRKGYYVLGVLGIFLPILWLIGAILPARLGSSYEIEESRRYLTPSEQL